METTKDIEKELWVLWEECHDKLYGSAAEELFMETVAEWIYNRG